MNETSILDSDFQSIQNANQLDIRQTILRIMVDAENQQASARPGSMIDRQYGLFLEMAGNLIFGKANDTSQNCG